MDMRSKAYPALPEGRGLQLVLPRAGDLRFRPQIPAAFVQRLYIHADPRRRLWYARFHLQRKFIVMSTQGDLYAKTTVSTFTMAELPQQNVLSMPRVSRGDLVKVLDLVQCSRSEGQRWELVFTRWRNGMETWLPLEVVQLYASNLLQEFYVNSINSWAFHSRVQPGNLSVFRTEVELWLFHPEFQDFYKRLRQKRSGGSRPQQQSGQGGDQVYVKPERSTLSSHTPQAMQPQATQPSVSVTPAVRDPSEAVLQEFEQRRISREQQEQREIREFEQRRIMRERQEQRQQIQRDQLVQLQQQLAVEQRRLDREREIQRIQGQEQTQRVQHEQQRKRAHEELQRSQKEYQQRLLAQQEREKAAERQQQERERHQRATEQERLRKRLQQSKARSDRPVQKQVESNQRVQETTTRKQLRYKDPQKKSTPHSASERPKDHNSNSIWSKGGDDAYVPDASESEGSESSGSSAGSESSNYSLSSRSTRRRRRKRLLYSQVELDDEDDDDDLPDLSVPRRRTRRRSAPETSSSEEDDPVRRPTRKTKKRKRLRQSNQEDGEESSGVDVDLTQVSGADESDDDSVELMTEKAVAAPEISSEDNGNTSNGGATADLVGDDDDDDDIDDLDSEPSIIVGEIRCGCGASSVGGYRGQWLQCWKEDCGVWEHADCVGFLTSFEVHPPPKYLCTQCDPEAYLVRCVKASQRILDWLFQCCDSRNSKQLMDLLEDNTGAANLPPDWKNAALENRTLAMHAARNGMIKCLSYLLDERKVDLYATDLQSRNVLHHAALGGSIVCCRFLLKRDRKLLLHQDQKGCMAFHLMLQSAKVNRLCVPFMKEDLALVGMGDLDSNFPIHYACQAVNSHTVEICLMIFAAQPTMLQEKSSEGLYPLMILCKASRTATTTRNKAHNASEVCKSAKGIIALMLNIDVFGDCLNQTGPDGWIPLHFAAASGNHELVTLLCSIGLFNVDYVAKESGQTALHVAAQENHPLCIRALLLDGLNVVAKDADGLIPMMYTEDAACVQEFLHYKLTKQLSRLHRMLGKFQHRGLVRRWQRCVARDAVSFDILNDWCQSDIERIERMEGILLSNPFLLRLDNKIDYVRECIIPSIKTTSGRCSLSVENREPVTESPKKRLGKKKLAFVFSRGKASFWKQFVAMGTRLEPEDFRLPIVFSIERGAGNSQGEGNLKLVLIWLAAGLLKAVPGLLVRGSSGGLETSPLSSDKEELDRQLLGFFMLGELIAHFVLFAVPLSGILDFTPSFLRCIGCKGKYQLANDEQWKFPGQSFAAGFEAVLPATLELFHANELRVLFNGPETALNGLQIDWDTAVEWDMRGSEAVRNEDTANAKMWLPRLMNELVEEEQQLVLLFMAETFPLVNEHFFRSKGSSGHITVSSYPETNDVLDYDTMYPTMEHKPDVLRLPSYSCYDVFKKRMLGVIRHTKDAFPTE